MSTTLETKIKELVNSETLSVSLAAPVLNDTLKKLKDLEAKVESQEKIIKGKEEANDDQGKRIEKLQDQLATCKEQLGEYRDREALILEKEKGQIRKELTINMLQEQVEFLKSENDKILRNAEVRKTLQTVMPVAVEGMRGLVDSNGMVCNYPTEGKVEHHSSTTTETKEEI